MAYKSGFTDFGIGIGICSACGEFTGAFMWMIRDAIDREVGPAV